MHKHIRRLLGVSGKEKSFDPKDRGEFSTSGRPRPGQATPQRPRRSQNAPLSKNSPFRCPECERGAHFGIAKRTPIEDFAPRMPKMRVWCSFLHPQTHPYRRFRLSDVHNASLVWMGLMYIYTYIHIYIYTHLHIYIHTYTHIPIHICINVYTCIHIYI